MILEQRSAVLVIERNLEVAYFLDNYIRHATNALTE